MSKCKPPSSPVSAAEKAGGSWETAVAPASVLPHPPPIPLLGLLMRTGEVGKGGWKTWRRAVESGGGSGVEKMKAGMMEEFKV